MIAAVLTGVLTLTQWNGLTTPPTPHHHHAPPAAARVATCESGGGNGGYSLTAQNPISSASGKYQFIDSTWRSVTGLAPPASDYPEHVQDAAFRELWDGGRGAHHWAPSRDCWAS